MKTESVAMTSVGLRSRAKSALEDRENMQRDYLTTVAIDRMHEIFQSTIEITSVDFNAKEVYFTADEINFRMRFMNAFTDNETQTIDIQRDERSWSKVENLIDVGTMLRLIEEKT